MRGAADVRSPLVPTDIRAKTLISTLYGDSILPHGGGVWLASVIRLAAPFGLSERMVRTAVFRLRRDGWLAAERHGRRSFYRLTADARRQCESAEERIYAIPVRHWDGRWTLVLPGPEIPLARRKALARELGWSGFAPLAPHLFAAPAEKCAAVERTVEESGFRGRVLCLRAETLPGFDGPALRTLIARTWPLDEVGAGYRRFIERFAPLRARLADTVPPDAEDAFVLRTLLIDAYRRTLLKDPGLPLPLLPPDWPGLAAAELARDLYRLLARPAQAHVGTVLAADGDVHAPAPAFKRRFGGL